MPDLTSLTLDQATGALTAKGLKLGTHETAASDDRPRGQGRSARTRRRRTGRRRAPRSTSSSPPGRTPSRCPTLEGMTKSQATSALKEVGLKLGTGDPGRVDRAGQGPRRGQQPGRRRHGRPRTPRSPSRSPAARSPCPTCVGRRSSEATTHADQRQPQGRRDPVRGEHPAEGTVIAQTNAGRRSTRASTVNAGDRQGRPRTPTTHADATPTSTGTPTTP